jgi:DNA-binding transcriptional LysR family regulator
MTAMLIRQLEYLVSLARERHFGRAAAACHVSQPALSSAIRRLELELGVPIVRRGQRYEGLTDEGERVLGWAVRLLADRDGLHDDLTSVQGGVAGRLRFGVIPTALPVSTLLTVPFLRAHPRASVEIHSLSSIEIERRLHAFDIDVGLTYLDNESLRNVRTEAVYAERYVLLTTLDGPLADRAEVTWREAAALPLCLLTGDMQNRRIVNALFAAAGAVPRPSVEANSVLTLCSHVQEGMGSSVLPHAWLHSVGAPAGTRALPIVDPVATHVVGLVLPDRDPEPSVVRAFRAAFDPPAIQAALDVLPGASAGGTSPGGPGA